MVCLNVAGAILSDSGLGSVGSLLRDNSGNWLLDFNKTIGVMDSLMSSFGHGLHVAWLNGFRSLLVHSYCVQVIKLILDPNASSSTIPLVRAIDKFRHRLALSGRLVKEIFLQAV
ncbi:uncharacterized protein LOC120185220 [Hibiscus syriacus]|nr:uncharacterized protein LOC120185220 [Hibiscus syriacus]